MTFTTQNPKEESSMGTPSTQQPPNQASGSSNAEQLASIIQTIDSQNIVVGAPGAWSLALPHTAITAQFLAGLPVTGTPAPATPTPGQLSLAQSAANKSNAAAAATPSAASGAPTTANTAASIINNVAGGITNIASIPADIKTVEAGATATLKWWGWTLQLNESATTAFERLLGTDVASCVTIASALAAISAPLAAVAGIISAVATGVDTWVTAEDKKGGNRGVTMKGYLWAGLWVEPAA
jgi:hypothetical protein